MDKNYSKQWPKVKRKHNKSVPQDWHLQSSLSKLISLNRRMQRPVLQTPTPPQNQREQSKTLKLPLTEWSRFWFVAECDRQFSKFLEKKSRGEVEQNTSWKVARPLAVSFKLLVLLFILTRILYNLQLTWWPLVKSKETRLKVPKIPKFLERLRKTWKKRRVRKWRIPVMLVDQTVHFNRLKYFFSLN